MKRNILYIGIQALLGMGILSMTACQSEELPATDGTGALLEIETPTHTTLSRTTLGTDGVSVQWTQGDEIAVYDKVAPKHCFAATIEDGTTHFRGKITPKQGTFMAVYPYDLAAENLVDGQMVVTLPATQTATPNTFSSGLNISVTKGERNIDGSPSMVRFANVCQVFKFTVPAYAAGRISSVQLQAEAVLAGQMNIGFSDNTPVLTVSEQGNKAVTILPPAGSDTFAEGTYCIVTLPTQMEGFTLQLTSTDGKTYRQHSSTSMGGSPNVIADLRTLDLIDVPQVSANHVYTDGVLQGTRVTLTAPVPDKAWSAVIKNADGTVVRTLQESTGTLVTDETDAEWPYLPVGDYTVEYNFRTANGKTLQAQTTFNISEQPEFNLSLTAASSYSYYLGQDVAKNIAKANSMDAHAVDGIVATVTGIAPKIINDSKYAGTLTNSFGSSVASTTDGIISLSSASLEPLGENTLTASYTFQGVTREASKTVYITGLPFRSEPPSSNLWTSQGKVSFKGSYAELGHNGTGSNFRIIYNHVAIPSGTNLKVDHSEYIHTATVGLSYYIYANNDAEIYTHKVSGGWKTDNVEGPSYYTAPSEITSIQCCSDYGVAQTYMQVKLIAVSYSE